MQSGTKEPDAVELGSELSFPASDPPSYMGSTAIAGPPQPRAAPAKAPQPVKDRIGTEPRPVNS